MLSCHPAVVRGWWSADSQLLKINLLWSGLLCLTPSRCGQRLVVSYSSTSEHQLAALGGWWSAISQLLNINFLWSSMNKFLERTLWLRFGEYSQKTLQNLAHGPKTVDSYNCKNLEIMLGGILPSGHGFPIRLHTSR